MWLATTLGFYSVVQKKDGVHVRARSEQDIENLISYCKLKRKPIFYSRADYRWRIIITVGELGHIMAKLTKLVKYDNFKNEVHKTNREREALYHRVWATLLAIEKEGLQ